MIVSILTNFFFPTQVNGYSPSIFGRKFMSVMLTFLIAFNLTASQLFPGFVQDVGAASYSAADLTQLTNSSRAAAGLVPLNYSKTLEAAAYAKAQDMLNKDYWAHFGPNGETPWQFITGKGYIYQFAGENLGRGFSNPSGLHEAWMASSTHYANIMKSEFRDIGIAIVDGVLQGEQTTLVVQFFGALPGAQTSTSSSVSSVSSTISENIVTSISNSTNSVFVSTSKVSNPAIVSKTLTSIATKVSTPKPEIPPNAPSITEPADNQLLNTNDITFKGFGDIDSTIQLFQNENKIGESIVENGGVWTYRNSSELVDGTYVYKANAVGKNSLISPFSNIVSIIIDKTAPSIVLEDIIGDDKFSENHNFTLKFKISNIQSDRLNIEVEKLGVVSSEYVYTPEENKLEMPVNLKDFEDVKITLKDDAGNFDDIYINNLQLKDQIFAYLKQKIGDDSISYIMDSNRIDQQSNTSNIFDIGALQSTLESLNVKQKVNISFASGFILLSIIDFLVLYKKKVSLNRAKNLLHVPQFAAILALAVLHGFGLII